MTTALLPACGQASVARRAGPWIPAAPLKGSEPERVLSLWLHARGEVVPQDRLSKLLSDPGTLLGSTARGLDGWAWAESTVGPGTILGVELSVPDRA